MTIKICTCPYCIESLHEVVKVQRILDYMRKQEVSLRTSNSKSIVTTSDRR